MTETNTTLSDLNALIDRIANLRAQEEEASRVKKEINELLEIEEARMIEMLASNQLTSYKGPGGKVVLAYRTSVRVPKEGNDKAALFEWLREKGLYDQLVSVNSQTLNSLYKSELDEAKERGETDFAIPGLRDVTMTPQLRFTRA